MRAIPMLLLLISSGWLVAQPSIAILRQQAIDDPPDVGVLIQLFEYYRLRDTDSAQYYVDRAGQLATRQMDPAALSRYFNALGLLLHAAGERDSALRAYRRAWQLCQQYDIADMRAAISSNLGQCWTRLANWDSAFYYYSLAERTYLTQASSYEIWKVYHGLGLLFQEKGDLPQAAVHFERAYEVVADRCNRMDVGFMIYALGYVYLNLEDFDRYAHYMDIWQQLQGSKSLQVPSAFAAEHAGFNYLFNRDDDLSRLQLEKALAAFQAGGKRVHLANAAEDLGNLSLRRGDDQVAAEYFLLAENAFEQLADTLKMASSARGLYQAAKGRGEFESALAHLERFTRYTERLRQRASDASLNELRVKYETDQKEQALQIQQLELQQKNQQLYVLWGLAVGLVLFGTFIFLNYRSRLRVQHQLSAQREQLQTQEIRRLQDEQELAAMRAMIEGQERERMRIGQDLHDGLGGLLTSIKSHLQVALPAGTRQTDLSLKTQELIDQACVEVRQISHNLMPSVLMMFGLDQAVENLAGQLRQQGLTVIVERLGASQELSEDRRMMLFRVVQEIVHNILKYAEAREVLIQLMYEQEQLSLIVEDDGTGFDAQAVPSQASLGLRNISSRVEYLNGSWHLDTAPGEGCAYTISIPLT